MLKNNSIIVSDPGDEIESIIDNFSGTRKIADPPGFCRHPEHRPPMFKVFSPGTYEHVCPGCKHKMIFTVPLITW